MALSTLENTNWKFQSQLSINQSESFKIRFQSGSTIYNTITFVFSAPSGDVQYSRILYDNKPVYEAQHGSSAYYLWYDEANRLIHIIDGDDVENEDLIYDMEHYTTQISGKEVFYNNMNMLSRIINQKSGTTGTNTIEEMVEKARNIGGGGIIPVGNQDIETLDEYDVTDKATARISAAERAKIIPANIANGVEILGVEGSHEGGITPTGNQDITTLDEYDVVYKATARVSAAERAKIIPANIKKDVEILGVTGTHEGGITPTGSIVINGNGTHDVTQYASAVVQVTPALQAKSVNPSTSQQVVTPDTGKDGLSQVTVGAVTNSIDANIVAENIKKDVEILGVVGSYEGSGSPTYDLQFSYAEPSDTTKIWVRTSQIPTKTRIVSSNPQFLNTLKYSGNSYLSNSACRVGTKIYSIGGQSAGVSPTIYDKIYSYDVNSGAYTEEATMPNALTESACVAIGEDIWIFGGKTASTTYTAIVRKYNTVSKTFTAVASMPSALYGHTALYVPEEQKIYIMFGTTSASDFNGKLYIYDITTNTYETITMDSYGVVYHVYGAYSFCLNGLIYAGGNVNVYRLVKTWISGGYQYSYTPVGKGLNQYSALTGAQSVIAPGGSFNIAYLLWERGMASYYVGSGGTYGSQAVSIKDELYQFIDGVRSYKQYYETSSASECVVKIINSELPIYPKIHSSLGDEYSVQAIYCADGNGKTNLMRCYRYTEGAWKQFCGEVEDYKIDVSVTNCTASSSNPVYAYTQGHTILTFNFDGEDYVCPASINAPTGVVSYSWTKVNDTQGQLRLSYAYEPVSVEVTGQKAVSGISIKVLMSGWPNSCTVNYNNASVYSGTDDSGEYDYVVPFVEGATLVINTYCRYGYVSITRNGVVVSSSSGTYSVTPSNGDNFIIDVYGED